MPETTEPQLTESEVSELADAFPHADYDPDTSEMPVCATCDGAIDDHKGNCVVPTIHALIRDWRALQEQVAKFSELADERHDLLSTERRENGELRLHRAQLSGQVEQLRQCVVAVGEENAALREQLATAREALTEISVKKYEESRSVSASASPKTRSEN